jgi:signal transduction histidine kinase
MNQKLKQTLVFKDNFFKIVVHDLKHPLTAFQDLADLLNYNIKQGAFDAVESIAYAIDRSSISSRLLIDSLFLEQEKPSAKLEYVSLLSCLENNLNLYQHVFEQKKISFQLQCSENIFVYANPIELNIVMRNLLDNALKAVDKEQPQFSIEASPSYQGNSIIINFHNNGKIMEIKQLNAINDLFANVSEQWQQTAYIGFGMWLIAKYVKKNKGSICCKSDKNTQETIFSLILPNFQIETSNFA